MSFFSINPLTLRNVNLSDPNATRKFQGDLAQLLYELTQNLGSASFLSQILNGQGLLFESALNPVISINGSQVGNLNVSCDNATSVFVLVLWAAATSTSLTLTHLSFGVPVFVTFINASASNNAYIVSATDTGGTTYAECGTAFAGASTGAGFVSLQSAQTLNAGNRIMLSGMSGGAIGAGRLYFAA